MRNMAELREVSGNRHCHLLAEHLIGRSTQCALRLAKNYVSAQHALIRWNGAGWEIVDRGSRNGTHLDGALLRPGRAYPLRDGARIAFGSLDECWVLVDATEPRAVVVRLDADDQLSSVDGIIGIPSASDPQCTLYRGSSGRWQLEFADGRAVDLRARQTFTVAGQTWCFYSPGPVTATATVEAARDQPLPELSFAVSSDEEFVALSLVYEDRLIELGSRTHNYLLLVLARARIADRKAGLPESECGWTPKDQLADDLRISAPQVDGEVFRIRKHFAQHGSDEAAAVIERRPGTRQLRVGFPRIVIQRR